MPRSRTRARIRALKLAAGAIQPDPEWTPGRLGHLLRVIWKRFAALEDYRIRAGREVGVSRPERRRAIAIAIDKWAVVQLTERKAKGRG
ncbi:hypothetical protein ASD38_13690 [Caulobacter sp. Root487D2Y]|uniref:hypothetical protein n=1 Tax=Caulobacter sp. Root487D2Y TaxID=1736547 RepID=UPI0007005DDB|nr:hypothetical protein [Caulobacter sp. Root487D2Y]KQY30316.1 hypothetical protein ASD38_13690 [Caulobacter sp. Root487D2Y]